MFVQLKNGASTFGSSFRMSSQAASPVNASDGWYHLYPRLQRKEKENIGGPARRAPRAKWWYFIIAKSKVWIHQSHRFIDSKPECWALREHGKRKWISSYRAGRARVANRSHPSLPGPSLRRFQTIRSLLKHQLDQASYCCLKFYLFTNLIFLTVSYWHDQYFVCTFYF